MKTIKRAQPRTRTTREISADYSMVDPRHTRKRSSQTTISLSSFSLYGLNSLQHAHQAAKQAEQVARRYTSATPRLLDIEIRSTGVRMHVAQPQLAVHLGKHFAQANKQLKPSTSVAWSRDRVNKVVDVKVEFYAAKHAAKKNPQAKRAPKQNRPAQELHKWSDWYAWQAKQQAKQKASE
ncbi:MAG: hypothetical protein AAB558_03520 [Patescibacteria group bacterium]